VARWESQTALNDARFMGGSWNRVVDLARPRGHLDQHRRYPGRFDLSCCWNHPPGSQAYAEQRIHPLQLSLAQRSRCRIVGGCGWAGCRSVDGGKDWFARTCAIGFYNPGCTRGAGADSSLGSSRRAVGVGLVGGRSASRLAAPALIPFYASRTMSLEKGRRGNGHRFSTGHLPLSALHAPGARSRGMPPVRRNTRQLPSGRTG
jgi:hypothetical protein